MNPFHHEHSDPWSHEFVDVESINAHVTNAIVERVNEARADTLDAKRAQSATMLIRGPAGSGKTHLFARLRRRCSHRATFVLLRPEIGVETTPRILLAKVFEALGREAFGVGERQIDIVTGATLGLLRGQRTFPLATLDELRLSGGERQEEAIEDVLEDVETAHADVSLNYLEQLLRLPFASSAGRRAAMAWLAGTEPTEAQLRRLGLRNALSDAEVLPALRTLVLLAALHAPLVLVFDQLENLYDADDRPDRINAYGNLVAELFDSVPGLVIVQMAVDSEWTRRIRPVLSTPQRSRLESRTFELHLPTPDERVELVKAWTNQLPEADRTPFPFTDAHLDAWRTQPGLTPRMLLIACRRVLEVETEEAAPALVAAPASAATMASAAPSAADDDVSQATSEQEDPLAERLAALWHDTLTEVRASIHAAQNDERPVPAERIAGALVCAGRLLEVRCALRLTPVNPTVHMARNGTALDVGVLQGRNAGNLGRTLQKATAHAAKLPTLIVRERAVAIPATWKTVERRRRDFINAACGTWLDLGNDELVHLIGLHDFESLARSGDLSASDGTVLPEARVLEWIAQTLDWRDWATIRTLQSCLGGEQAPSIEGVSSPAAAESAAATPSLYPSTPPPSPTDGLALSVLRRLHLASIDRLVREARETDANVSRKALLDELTAADDAVTWLGQSLVCTKEIAS